MIYNDSHADSESGASTQYNPLLPRSFTHTLNPPLPFNTHPNPQTTIPINHQQSKLLRFRHLGLELLERSDVDPLDQSIEFVSGLVLLIFLAVQPDSNSTRNVADSPGPEEVIERVVDSDVVGEHVLAREVPDDLDGAGGLLLELDSVASLVEVDGVVPGHGGEFLVVLILDHRWIYISGSGRGRLREVRIKILLGVRGMGYGVWGLGYGVKEIGRAND